MSVSEISDTVYCSICETSLGQEVYFIADDDVNFVLCDRCHDHGFFDGHETFSAKLINQATEVQNTMFGFGVIHPNISCDECSTSNIRGKRYKCKECFDYDLCAGCKSQGQHVYHSMMEIAKPRTPQEKVVDRARDTYLQDRLAAAAQAVHLNVECDVCEMNPVRGLRYRCNTCSDFDLCATCKGSGHHYHHAFTEISIPRVRGQDLPGGLMVASLLFEGLSSGVSAGQALATGLERAADIVEANRIYSHAGIGCDVCKQIPLIGPRYQCIECSDYDICKTCKDQGHHSFHAMMEIAKPKSDQERAADRARRETKKQTQLEAASVRHTGIKCDHCRKMPIVGIRHKCNECLDFDLCSTCTDQGQHSHHAMTDIWTPRSPQERAAEYERAILQQASQTHQSVVHRGITCDVCEQNPLQGVRYKCNECDDYDLCGRCKVQGQHSQHLMIQINTPWTAQEIVSGRRRRNEASRQLTTTQTVTTLTLPSGVQAEPTLESEQPSITETSAEEIKERMTCPICMDAEKNMALMCGHSFCEACCSQIRECAICKKKITGRIKLFN